MRFASLLAATAALGSIAIAGPSSAQVIFGDSGGDGAYIYAEDSAFALADSGMDSGVDPGVSNYNFGNNSLGTLSLSPFSTTASTSATDTYAPLAASGTASGSATALFDSAAVGQVEFTGSQSATSNSDSGSAYGAGGGYFAYFFQPTTATTFSVNYDLSSSTIGCCGDGVRLYDLSTGYYTLYQTIFDADNTGLLTTNLAAGDNYKLEISDSKYPEYDAATVFGVGTSSVPYDDRYSFSIASVSAAPEPSIWLLMITGVGLAGGMLRRARNAPALSDGAPFAA